MNIKQYTNQLDVAVQKRKAMNYELFSQWDSAFMRQAIYACMTNDPTCHVEYHLEELKAAPIEDILAATPEQCLELSHTLAKLEYENNRWIKVLNEQAMKLHMPMQLTGSIDTYPLRQLLVEPQTLIATLDRYILEPQNSDFDLAGTTAEEDKQQMIALGMSLRPMSPEQRAEKLSGIVRTMQQQYEQTTLFKLFRRTQKAGTGRWSVTLDSYLAFFFEHRTKPYAAEGIIRLLRFYRNRYQLWKYSYSSDDLIIEEKDSHPHTVEFEGERAWDTSFIYDPHFPLDVEEKLEQVDGQVRLCATVKHEKETRQLLRPLDVESIEKGNPADAARKQGLQQETERLQLELDELRKKQAECLSVKELVDYAIGMGDHAQAQVLKLAIYELMGDRPGNWREQLSRIDAAYKAANTELLKRAAKNGLTVGTVNELHNTGTINDVHDNANVNTLDAPKRNKALNANRTDKKKIINKKKRKENP